MSGQLLKDAVQALLTKQGVEETIEDLSKRILHDAKVIELADELARTSHDYMVAVVKRGPYDCGKEAMAHVQALQRYREGRPAVDWLGVKP